MPNVNQQTAAALRGVAQGDMAALAAASSELREVQLEATGLDPSSFALVKIAALIAIDAPPASFAWQVANALEAGVTPEQIVGVLQAVAPQVGLPKVIAAAPEIMLALDIALDEETV